MIASASQSSARQRSRKRAKEAITFEDFAGTLLGAWYEDEGAPAGDVFTSARDAAARCAFEAAVVHGGKPGSILLTCSDYAGARSALSYLSSFFSDSPELKRLCKRVAGDSIELRGGGVITVTADQTRRPKSLLASIRLEPRSSPVSPKEEMDDDELAKVFAHALAGPIGGHRKPTDEDWELLRALGQASTPARSPEEVLENLQLVHQGWCKEREEAHRRAFDQPIGPSHPARDYPQYTAMTPTSVPQVPRKPDPAASYYDKDIFAESLEVAEVAAAKQRWMADAELTPREKFLVSPEYERQRAERMGQAEIRDGSRHDRALTGRRRR